MQCDVSLENICVMYGGARGFGRYSTRVPN